MKPANLVLLALILIIGIVNLLATFGVIGGKGGGSGGWDYRVLNSAQMDLVGFKAVADEEGLQADAEGRIPLKEFPEEKVVTQALMARTLTEIEKEGWEFVGATTSVVVSTGTQGGSRSDRFFIFRKAK